MSEATNLNKEIEERQLQRLRDQEIDFDRKLAAIKGMIEVFVIATIGFVASMGVIMRFDVKDGIEAWWLASSVGCVLAVGGLFKGLDAVDQGVQPDTQPQRLC